MIKWGLNNLGYDYEIAAIIGPQSSGKSTILNNAFGTNFAVMDPRERGRTTNGIWLSRDKTHNLLIMDVEGSDSGSRLDDQSFERKAAMFALACSRLLIVNMLEDQVGLYNGGNLGLLRIVFEEHIAMYGKLDKRQVERVYHRPKFLFLIQRLSGRTPLASLSRTVISGLDTVWDSIEKPEEIQDQRLQEYFTFHFESLPDFLHASEQYNSEVNSLRKRFVDKQSSDYLLKDADPNAISADGLDLYMQTIWGALRTNENLNLPGQHELLAQAMCERILTSLLEKYRPKFDAQSAILNEGKVIDDLGSLLRGWKSEILVLYDEEARRYLQSANTEKRYTLVDSCHSEAYKLFTSQLRNLRNSILASFDVVLEDAASKEDSEFDAITSEAKNRHEDAFALVATTTAIEDANWDWQDAFKELNSDLSHRIRASNKERKATEPLTASKDEWVESDKLIASKATLYRDGMLVVEVKVDNYDPFHGLRGRVLIVVRDKDGNAIGVTNELRSSTACGTFDPFCSSDRSDWFTLRFPRSVGRRAAVMDIYQRDGGSLGNVLKKFLEVAKIVVAVRA
ncbi:hypothetical protein GALMADRAFT_75720 [Galerina marginata CBS 339.88]|uniref:GB1/RHD3-type G domain-containing protein n=1 Tax=Galerina marginata (strain CBS 339.88) TaxID=685588 RepID=A0A067ST15_GALM3|nr:hypothetical protein GALMADRAFT_75720 [Galerina marginata CBS 339.88]